MSVRNYAMSVLLYRTSAPQHPQVALKFANGERHKGLPRRADPHRLVMILNRASQNLLVSSRPKAGMVTTSASFLVKH